MNSTAASKPYCVIKVGGECLEHPGLLQNLAADLLAAKDNYAFVMVHGGGAQIDRVCRQLGIAIEKVNGRRITSPEVLSVMHMTVSGELNARLVSVLQKAGIPAAGITGCDGGLIQAQRRPAVEVSCPDTGKVQTVDFGLVGDVEQVNPEILRALSGSGMLPVISCFGGKDGERYNINADTIATEIAIALKARILILVSSMPGVYRDLNDRQSLIPQILESEIDELLASGGITDGMIPKFQNARHSLSQGVQAIYLIDGSSENDRVSNALAGSISGTVFRADH